MSLHAKPILDIDFIHCQKCGRTPNLKVPIIVGQCSRTFCVMCARHHTKCDRYRPCKFFKIDSKLGEKLPKISNVFIDSSVQSVHSAKKIIRNRKYSRVLCERQIKILNLKINHYLSRLTMCKQPIRIKNKEIKAKRIQNKKLKEAAKKMKEKYSKKKVVWNNKRAKWKLKLKRIQILISKAKEKQKNTHGLIKKAQKERAARIKRLRYQKRPKLPRLFSSSVRKISPFNSFKHPKENFQTTLSCVKVTHFVYSQIPKNASLLGIFPDFSENFQKSSMRKHHLIILGSRM